MKKINLIIAMLAMILICTVSTQAQSITQVQVLVDKNGTQIQQFTNNETVRVIQMMNLFLPDTIIERKCILFSFSEEKLGINVTFPKFKYGTFFDAENFSFLSYDENQLLIVLPEEKDTFIVLKIGDEDLKNLKTICGKK